MDNENKIMNQNFHDENRSPDSRWFWKNGLSIDETKMSTLIICLLACMTFGGMNYILHGDITNNLTAIIQALIYAIAGINIGNGLINKFNGNNMANNMSNSVMDNTNIRDTSAGNNTAIPPGVTSVPTSTQNTNVPRQR